MFPVFACAQTKTTADSAARATLNNLINSWTLGIDSSNEAIDIAVDIKLYNKFKDLFDSSATVDDDFNVFYEHDPKNKTGSYKIKKEGRPKIFDAYAHDAALQVRRISIDSVRVLDSGMTDQKNITFTVRRKVRIQKTREYVLPVTYANEVISSRTIAFEEKKDSVVMAANLKTKVGANTEAIYEFTSVNTVLITMVFEANTAKIASIKSVANEVVCNNDADYDTVLDREDSLKNKFGDFTASGMPDYDLDGSSDEKDKCKLTYGDLNNKGCPPSYFLTKNEFDGFVGLQFNMAKINLPEINQLGYRNAAGTDLVDHNPSLTKKGVLNNPGMIAGINAGANFIRYFGQKRKRSGISMGFTYSALTATYKLDESQPIAYTFKSSDGINDYRRVITIRKLSEDISYGVFNLPVLFNFRSHLDKKHKVVINLRAGPSIMFFRNTSDYNTTIDFEGLYQINPGQGKIEYTSPFNATSIYNIFFTVNKINEVKTGPGADSVFKWLGSNYDFASNKNYRSKQPLKRIAVALNLAADLQYKVSEGLIIKVSPHYVYAPLPERKNKYKPIDRTTEEYQSIYKSTAKSNYSAYGASLGFVYDF